MREKLLAKRQSLLDEAEAILTAAVEADRGLTDEEKAKHDALVAQARAINDLLTANAAAEAQAAVTVPVSQTTATAVATGQMPPETPGAAGASTPAPPASRATVQTRTPERGEVMGAIVRGVIAHRGNHAAAMEWARQTYGEQSPQYHALGVTEFTSGGALIPTQVVNEVIELLRARSVVMSLNPVTLNFSNGIAEIPKIAGGAVGAYLGDNDPAGVERQEFGQLKLVEKYLASIVPVSNNLIRNSGPNVDAIIRDDLLQGLASTADAAMIRALGTEHSPKGLRYWAVAAHIAASAGTTLANVRTDIRRCINLLAAANVRMLRPAWLMAPRSKNYLMWDLADGNNNLPFQDQLAAGTLNGWRVGETNHIPTNISTNQSEVYLVDFADVVVAEGQTIQIDASQEASYVENGTTKSAFQRNQTVIRALMAHDLGMRHDESIAVRTEVTWGAA